MLCEGSRALLVLTIEIPCALVNRAYCSTCSTPAVLPRHDFWEGFCVFDGFVESLVDAKQVALIDHVDYFANWSGVLGWVFLLALCWRHGHVIVNGSIKDADPRTCFCVRGQH